MFRTVALQLSKRMVMPQLSPTHTFSKILEWRVQPSDHVEEYDPVFVVECSPDFLTEANRGDKNAVMIVESLEEGQIRNPEEKFTPNQWVKVGTELATIDDGDPVDGDWTWQAYLHGDPEEESK